MTTCRFCAEEIQAAAIVCKHCHRDLVPIAVASPARWRGRIVLAIAALGLAVLASMYFSEDHQRYLAFETQRAAWHQKCDRYVGKPPASLGADLEEATFCTRELDAMLRVARERGWN